MDYTDVSEVAAALADETEIGTDRAERVAEDIAREANHDLGDPAALYNSVTAGSGLIVDADLELVSGVETPAVDSDFVALKSTADEEIPLGKNLDDPEFSEGDPVRWSSQGVPVHGRVAGIHEQYSPNPDVTITGDEGEAVYSIYQWDDSLATPEFQISPSEPNIAKPQSSLSESQKDMPPATDDNFNRVSDSLGKALEVPAADVAQLLYPDRQTAAQVALRMGLGEPGEDPDTMTHPHTMDGAEMYMPGETHADFTEAVAGPEADTLQTLKQESTAQGDMGTDENEAGTDPDSGEGDRTLTAADVSAVADELREAGISAGGRGGDTDLGDMVAEKEIAPDTLLDVMAQAEAIDADAEELAGLLLDFVDCMIVRWNGTEWRALDDTHRQAILADAYAKWSIDGLLRAFAQIPDAVETDRGDLFGEIEEFR